MNSCLAEQLVGIEFSNQLSVCGCVDLIGFDKDDELIIADHKTYASMTNEKKQNIAWQLSIYDYMLRQAKVINGIKLHYTGAKKFYIYWYRKDGSLEVIGVDKVSDFEIELINTHENRILKLEKTFDNTYYCKCGTNFKVNALDIKFNWIFII